VSVKGTLTLALLLVLLCGGYFLMLYMEESNKFQKIESQKVFSLAPEEISGLEVQRVGEALVTAHRSPEEAWVIDLPNPSIEPNPVVWERMATATATLLNQRTIDADAADPKKYGLDDPVVTIGIIKPDKTKLRLEFGALDPTQSYRYTRADDGPIFLITTKAFNEFDRPLSLLRNPYVVAVGEGGITRFEFSHFWTKKPQENADTSKDPEFGRESVVVSVEKGADGVWRMVTPEEAVANQELVEQFLKQVQFATAQNHIDEPKNLEDYGLEPPRARITLYTGADAAPQTLQLGAQASTDKDKPTIFAKQKERPAVFEMDANVLNLLPKTPDAFRESRLLSHAVNDITKLEYTAEGAQVVLENDPNKGWRLVGAPGETDQMAVSNFLATLKALQGRGFPGEATPEFGLDKPRVLIAMHLKDGSTASVRVGAEVQNAEQSYATLDNGTVTLLNALDVAALTKPESYFKNKSLLSFKPEEAVRLAMSFEGANYVFEKPRGVWIVKEPSGKTLSSGSDVDMLLKTLNELRLERVESDSVPEDLKPYGLYAPLAVISVMTSSQSEKGMTTVGPFKVGAPAPDDSQMRFALSEGRPGVYRIRQALVDEIRETLKALK